MALATTLIVLNLTKIGEKSVVLHTLSPEYGRRSFIASISRSTPMALFQPLSILDAEIVENSKSDLWRVHALSAKYPLNSLRTDLYKNSITMFMSEVLFRAVRDGACEQGLFEWAERQILTLDALESDFSNFHLRFLLELCGAMGFRAEHEDLAPFAGRQYDNICSMMTLGFAESMILPLSGRDRNEIASALLDYLGFHTDSKIEVRSLKVLREILN